MKIDINKTLSGIKPKNGRFYTIAIDGRGGSGKSKLGDYLENILKGVTIITGDDYFEPVEDQIVWGAFNNERFIKDVIDPIKTSDHFIYHPFNWEAGPVYHEIPIKIKQGICIERCYSFAFDIDWDLKIWVETPKDICRQRGIARTSMPKHRVRLAWETVWQPLETKYIKETQPLKIADIVLSGTKPFNDQIY